MKSTQYPLILYSDDAAIMEIPESKLGSFSAT